MGGAHESRRELSRNVVQLSHIRMRVEDTFVTIPRARREGVPALALVALPGYSRPGIMAPRLPCPSRGHGETNAIIPNGKKYRTQRSLLTAR
jgi:hypothetical protein